jgi:hypothetical protein
MSVEDQILVFGLGTRGAVKALARLGRKHPL